MVPTAVGTMSNRCLVGFIQVGLVRNVEGVDRSQKSEVKLRSQKLQQEQICDRTIFVESERVYNDNDEFRKKANSNYELTNNFSERNKNAGDGVRTHDLQISEGEAKFRQKKGGGLLCT